MFDWDQCRNTLLSTAAAMWSVLLAASSAAQAMPSVTDIAQAKSVFADAQAVSKKEGGHLWGMPLYGRMLVVDPDTRDAVSNMPDPDKRLTSADGVYVGTLPKNIIISNAPLEWEGQRWTMLMLPTIPKDAMTRSITLAHEMFHRIQPRLGLMATDSPNPQFDTEQGRIWLQLEWRALAAALIETGAAQTQAIRDAIAFRAWRHKLFPGSAKTEASLEIAEGVPQYTGTVAAEPDVYAARWRAAADLAHPDTAVSFVRFFAYISGPGYGLLLDERMPGWRRKLTAQSDLAELLGSTLPGRSTESAKARAPVYGASEIMLAEADRAARVHVQKVRYRALLVDGPTLKLPAPGNFSFNPSAIISLGKDGNVYPTFHAISKWGTLDVKAGALIPSDFSWTVVAAPKSAATSHLIGPGWTLDLARGWTVVPATKAGSYVLHH